MANKLSQREIEELKSLFQTGNLTAVAAKLQERLKSLENIPLDIAITGVTGSGKSSFVNAIRGLRDDDENAAETGSTQTTMKPNPYPYPRHPNVKIWDLPGTGTPSFQPDKYLKKVNFDTYDVFIIIAASRFTCYDTDLAREIQKRGKRFYYVRSKVDNDLKGEKRKRNFSEERTLQRIREECIENLTKMGERFPRVFLISSWKPEKYNFQLLQETLLNDLDENKRHGFIVALPNLSENFLEKKKAELQKQILEVAFLSCVLGAVPLPGLSLVCDIAILVFHMKRYCEAFGLTDEALTALARKVDKPVEELKSVMKKSPLDSGITKDFVLSLLSKCVCGALMIVELALDFVPVLGALVGGGLSFLTTRYLLKSFLDDAAEDAQNVLAKALEPKA